MHQNIQPPEPARKHHDGEVLSVHSIFHTLQGEGPFTGHPAVFIRLAGCNLQCPGCDTEYTSGRHSMGIAEVVGKVMMMGHGNHVPLLVVITGGEPLRQNIDPLIRRLHSVFPASVYPGFSVQIESNGVLPLSNGLIELIRYTPTYLVCSPKTSRIHPTVGEHAHAFKYVLNVGNVHEKDGLPLTALGHRADPHVARPPLEYKGPIYVNPMDAHDDALNVANIKETVKSAMRFGYIAGLQCHKYWDLP
ncbi:7-carboxy-7-deazaguanine synthase [Synechococcus phage Ssp-JY38]|nr:7-carboxy-7-deazaguanine synthase [Synechococcus phage Yong-L2-223]